MENLSTSFPWCTLGRHQIKVSHNNTIDVLVSTFFPVSLNNYSNYEIGYKGGYCFLGGDMKGGGGRPFFGERVGGTLFSAREEVNTWN
jgi:hypothetical protein